MKYQVIQQMILVFGIKYAMRNKILNHNKRIGL